MFHIKGKIYFYIKKTDNSFPLAWELYSNFYLLLRKGSLEIFVAICDCTKVICEAVDPKTQLEISPIREIYELKSSLRFGKDGSFDISSLNFSKTPFVIFLHLSKVQNYPFI